MKKIFLAFAATSLIFACNKKENTQEVINSTENQIKYQVFGDSISADGALSKEEMLAKYETMKLADTLDVKFSSEIISTCKKKGCWMSVNLSDEKKAFIQFKGYTFFVPKEGAENHNTVISGKAFISETPVDELKHYAKDAGKSQEEIDAITKPEVEYRFMANGVLIAEN